SLGEEVHRQTVTAGHPESVASGVVGERHDARGDADDPDRYLVVRVVDAAGGRSVDAVQHVARVLGVIEVLPIEGHARRDAEWPEGGTFRRHHVRDDVTRSGQRWFRGDELKREERECEDDRECARVPTFHACPSPFAEPVGIAPIGAYVKSGVDMWGRGASSPFASSPLECAGAKRRASTIRSLAWPSPKGLATCAMR